MSSHENANGRKQNLLSRRLLKNRIASCVVSLGGLCVVLSVIGIILVIGSEFLGLFSSISINEKPSVKLYRSYSARALVFDDYAQVVSLVDTEGYVRILEVGTGALLKEEKIPFPEGSHISQIAKGGQGSLLAANEEDRLIRFFLNYDYKYLRENEKIRPTSSSRIEFIAQQIEPPECKLKDLAYLSDEDGWHAALLCESGRSLEIIYEESVDNPFLEVGPQLKRVKLAVDSLGGISAMQFFHSGQKLILASDKGELISFFKSSDGEYRESTRAFVTASTDWGITALALLSGGEKIVCGDSQGFITGWTIAREGDGSEVFKKTSDYMQLDSALIHLHASSRNRLFFAVSKNLQASIIHGSTSLSHQFRLERSSELELVEFSPRANQLFLLFQPDILSHFSLDAQFASVSFGSMFKKMWYEGYSSEEHVWQSSGGSDDYESKLGLVPLIYGTLKGTFYAMLFAIPIAVLAAIYTSQFLHPKLKNIVKPAVELLAAFPSVVIGLLAGLWLAPRVEHFLLGILLFPVFLFLTTCLFSFFLSNLKDKLGITLGEILPIMLGTICAFCLSLTVGNMLEIILFSGDLPGWMENTLGWNYDQRNSLIIGIAMGFAVVPIIFTISEDCLASVPKNIEAGSLALGASRWQTAIQVILPAASPGIFSAIAIGFGRAVGETMIVLMATGNTPIMDMSIFNGFRALSANIAVELPEAPHGESLYMVLFFSAFLLFMFTFFVNMLAELVRSHLRKRFQPV